MRFRGDSKVSARPLRELATKRAEMIDDRRIQKSIEERGRSANGCGAE